MSARGSDEWSPSLIAVTARIPTAARAETVSADDAAVRLGICVGSIHKLIRKGALPGTQLMHSAP